MSYWIAGATVVSAVVGAVSSNNASNKQQNAAREAQNSQERMTYAQLDQQKEMYEKNVERMQPYVEAGQGSLAQLKQGMQPNGQFMQKFSGSNFEQDPSYQWRLQQGMKALMASGAAKGTVGSTQGMRDITNYAQGAASQEYQAAYNRFQDQQSLLFNRLNTVAGNSQNAAAGLGAMGTQVSSNLAGTAMQGTALMNDYRLQGANAAAAGQVGMTNAITGSMSSGYNAYMQQQYLNSLNAKNNQPQQQQTPPNSGPQLPLGEIGAS